MRKILYTLLCGFILSAGAQAQIKLIGASYNTGTSSIDLLQWSAFDSLSVTTTPTGLESYVFGTSAFDPFNSNYYIAGISGLTTGLYSFNTEFNEDSLSTGSLYTNVSEFDMSTGKMYNLIMETEEYISIYAYDIETDQDSLIGTIYEEGVIGIVADAIGFDSNNGILYYVGYTNDPAAALYSIPVREESFSFTRTILTTPEVNSTITSLNFDNVNEKLFATYDSYDENANYNGRNIVQIDVASGDVYTLGLLSEFDYFVGGSSLFDQNTGTFLLVGITNTNQLEMIAFDTFTNNYTTGFVPNNVSEIQCDNSLFAKTRYATAGIDPQAALNFNVYPNPVSDVLNLEYATQGPVHVQIFSSTGELVYAKNNITGNRMNVDMSALSAGLYMVNLSGSKETVSKKILVR